MKEIMSKIMAAEVTSNLSEDDMRELIDRTKEKVQEQDMTLQESSELYQRFVHIADFLDSVDPDKLEVAVNAADDLAEILRAENHLEEHGIEKDEHADRKTELVIETAREIQSLGDSDE